ncbi:hypothetical protein QG37_06036 [Candidozyma auris]|nr:hypothetical protein QG37_06036 [[Candida] auris]
MFLGHLGSVPPRGSEVAGESVSLRVVDVAGREGGDFVTLVNQALQLGGEIASVWGLGRLTHVQRRDTYRVSGSQDSVLSLVVQHPGEHTVQVFGGVDVVLSGQGNDGLTVGVRLVWVVGESCSQSDVVVDFTVDGQRVTAIWRSDGLGARVQADDGQSLVAQDGGVRNNVTRPVGASVSDFFGVFKSDILELVDVGSPVGGVYSTHNASGRRVKRGWRWF